MWKSKRLSKLQVSGRMPRGTLGDVIETNLRLIVGDAGESVTCRRVVVESGIWSDDLRQTVCSVLRRRDHLIAVPSPFERREILVASTDGVACGAIERAGWHAKLHDMARVQDLRFTDEHELEIIADLTQRALVLGFETDGSYWRLGNSTRYWHARQPTEVVDGIQAVHRVSFATLPLAGTAVGIAFDSGFLYRSEQSVAYFFDQRAGTHERDRRQRQFDRLRCRQARFKGNLLYDTGRSQHQVCYFDHFGDGQTLEKTGPVMNYESLYAYCMARHKYKGYQPDDPVAYVSFKGIPQVVPVPAKQLRLRVMLSPEQMPNELSRATSTAPSMRRETIVNLWDRCNKSGLNVLGAQAQAGLWQPTGSDHELLPCPELIFGKGRRVAPPADPTITEYRSYYHKRMEALKNGGVFYFDESAGREIYLVTPSISAAWSETLHHAFVDDFTKCISDFAGLRFGVHEIHADGVESIVERLGTAVTNRPFGGGRTALVVFDDKSDDPAPYCLLSNRVVRWNLKRVKRLTVEKKWRVRQQAPDHKALRRAEDHWRSMIELIVLDTLVRMNATPWRLKESPYDACLAIDVGEGRRYFAMSLLVCRDNAARPSYFRATLAWPKGDSDREQINSVHLQDKIPSIFQRYCGSFTPPLKSLLILRDGRFCGDEVSTIAKAMDHLHKIDRLSQSARVDLAEVHKKTVKDLRMWYPVEETFANVLEGHAVYLDDACALISCTGGATLSPFVTADPCLLNACAGGDIRHIARGFFSFAQLNYSTPNKAHRCALPICMTDDELRQKLAQDMRGIK